MFSKFEGFAMLAGGLVAGLAVGYTTARSKFIDILAKAALENAVEKEEDQKEEA